MMTLKDFFASLGYNISPFLGNEDNISKYEQWYNGIANDFHRYYIYNGNKKIYRNRYSLRFPKKICETFADLICNERVKIHLSDDRSSKILEEILSDNNFRLKLNQSIEKAFAFGYGAFVLCIEDNKIKIQFVDCKNIIPLRYDVNHIYDVAFISDSYDEAGNIIRNIQVHHLNQQKQYIIDNFKMDASDGGELKLMEFEDIPKSIDTKSDIPWFSIIKPNIVNNLLIDSPFGIPVYYNSIDTIKSLDIIFDSFVNEIQNGRKRLFVTADALKLDSRGNMKNAFDPNDVLFYLLDAEEEDKKAYVQEVNGALRIEELKLALQTNLDILSSKLGLGSSYYKIGNGSNSFMKTATEVVSSNSDLYRTINKHCILINSSLKSLIKAIQYISKEIFNVNIDGDIFIDFDDSIIESDAEKREQDRKDVQLGVMSLAEYRSKWYDEPLDVAEEKIANMQARREANSSVQITSQTDCPTGA